MQTFGVDWRYIIAQFDRPQGRRAIQHANKCEYPGDEAHPRMWRTKVMIAIRIEDNHASDGHRRTDTL